MDEQAMVFGFTDEFVKLSMARKHQAVEYARQRIFPRLRPDEIGEFSRAVRKSTFRTPVLRKMFYKPGRSPEAVAAVENLWRRFAVAGDLPKGAPLRTKIKLKPSRYKKDTSRSDWVPFGAGPVGRTRVNPAEIRDANREIREMIGDALPAIKKELGRKKGEMGENLVERIGDFLSHARGVR